MMRSTSLQRKGAADDATEAAPLQSMASPRTDAVSFRDRVVLLAVGLALALTLLVTAVLERQHRLQLLETSSVAVSRTVGSLATAARGPLTRDDVAAIERVVTSFARLPGVVAAEVSDADGKIVARAAGDDPNETRETVQGAAQDVTVDGRRVGTVRIELDVELAAAAGARTAVVAWSSGVLALLVGVGLIEVLLLRPRRAVQEASAFAQRLDVEMGTQMPVPDTARDVRDLIVALNDASTKLKLQAESLRESEAWASKLALVAARISHGVVITDAEQRIEWVNEGFTRMTGYALEEVIGSHPGELLQGDDSDPAKVRFMRERIDRQEGFETQLVNYAKDGRAFEVAIEVRPVFDENGRLRQYVAIHTDVTGRERVAAELERQRQAAERANRAKGEFLSRMSHELRTPLTAIVGFAELMGMDEVSADQRDSLARIGDASRHLLRLVNEILDLSGVEAGQLALAPQPVPLNDHLQAAATLMRPMADEQGVVLDPGRHDPRLQALCDEQRLTQVVLNLISNAIRYGRRGGTVRLLSRSVPAGVRIIVEDDGPGIAPELVKRLFVPFDRLDVEKRTQVDGSGIGLALCKRLVEAMGGAIGVESEPGTGSRFWLELPSAEPLAVEPPDVPAHQERRSPRTGGSE